MLQVLVESRALRPRRTTWTAISVAVHSAILAVAVLLTARAVPDTRRPEPGEDLIYVPSPPVPATAPAPIAAIAPIVLSRLSFSVPRISMPAILAPSPDVFSGVIEELRTAAFGVMVGARPGNAVTPGGIHTAGDVDRIVAPLPGNPSPTYPTRLSTAGIEGDVVARFVVDTMGRVEAPSIEILAASHALFGEAVRQWLKQTRYSPAIANGRAVRQLVQQRIGFALKR